MASKEGYRLRDMSRPGLGALIVAVVGLALLWSSTLLDFDLAGQWFVVALVVAGVVVVVLVSELRRLRRGRKPFLRP